MKRKTIGIMGALICNDNMGCVALSYSLLLLLERIGKESGYDFCYIIFEDYFDSKKYKKVEAFLQIEPNKIHQTPIADFNNDNWKIIIKSFLKRLRMKKMIKKCDLVIDITRGDSFTDIYGTGRFWKLTKVKEIVETMGIPLILAPQTYGPFQDNKVQMFAKQVIESANFVMSRDKASATYLKRFCNKDVFVTTDLAFSLPYEEHSKEKVKSIKIGVNPSGLLASEKSEGTKLCVNLTVDYDNYIKDLLDYLEEAGNYEIHLIPHVGEDAVQNFGYNRKNVIVHSAFDTPVEAKNYISQMDIFIGSRMHATIGALSSGVVTIPVAYSRKFSGLFENIGYNHIIDLCSLDNETALKRTIEEIVEYENSIKDVECARVIIKEQCEQLYQTLKCIVVETLEK